MKAKAIRGVCIGPERHLAVGDVADLEPQLVSYLASIGAVVPLADEQPMPDQAQPEKPAKAGKPKE